MDEQRILEELTGLLEAGGVIIRSEGLGGIGGGLCKMKGETIFFIDTEASACQAAAVCAEAVAEMVDIENVYIRPEVRRFIDDYGKKHKN